METSDPTTKMFQASLDGRVLAFFIAAEIPYAEYDIASEIEARLQEVMEDSGEGLLIRQSAAEEVNERARELLSISRRLRRYLRRIASVIEKIEDPELQASLGEAGPFVLLVEMQRFAESSNPNPVELVIEEVFEEQGERLIVRSDRQQVIEELKQRTAELKLELEQDDF